MNWPAKKASTMIGPIEAIVCVIIFATSLSLRIEPAAMPYARAGSRNAKKIIGTMTVTQRGNGPAGAGPWSIPPRHQTIATTAPAKITAVATAHPSPRHWAPVIRCPARSSVVGAEAPPRSASRWFSLGSTNHAVTAQPMSARNTVEAAANHQLHVAATR